MSDTSHTIRDRDSQLLARRAAQVQRGGARAAVLGLNDGLVSTICLVLGVFAAGGSRDAVLLAGLAGLLAGAISMAAGEWISVRSQVELFQGILADLRGMVTHDKALLVDNLAKQLESDGVSAKTAKAASDQLASQDGFFDVYSAQVIGLNPDELGSPWTAASSSFALFSLGSLAPLAPWFFGADMTTVWVSIALTAIGGALAGGFVAYSSGKSLSIGALRQVGIVLFAAGITYFIGTLFGTLTS